MDIHRITRKPRLADDISLLAHSHRDIQSKTEKLVRNAAKVGLHVNKDKTKTMRNNSQTADPENKTEDVTEFTYLGAKVTKDGNTEAELKTRINNARGAFAALKNIWKTKMISKKTKIRIFKSNVLSVLLYIILCCRVLESDQRNMPHAGSIPKQVP